MKQLEFDAEVSKTRTLKIPSTLARHVGVHQTVHVIVSTPERPQVRRAPNGKAAALMATFGSCQDKSLARIFQRISRKRRGERGRAVINL